SGTSVVPNTFGIQIFGGASGNTIGGTAAGARNVISGNFAGGLNLGSSANVAEGNYVGTTASGQAALANLGVGLDVLASGNTIGGTAPGAGNVISGNLGNGIEIENSSSGTVVAGNLIGTNAGGTNSIPNG